MIPELGQVFLVVALASALLQFFGGISSLFIKTQNIEISAHFANNAAAIVVGKSGTATATMQEIEKIST